jgi:hypothetical protein
VKARKAEEVMSEEDRETVRKALLRTPLTVGEARSIAEHLTQQQNLWRMQKAMQEHPELFAPYMPLWVWRVLRDTGAQWYLAPKVLVWCAADPEKRVPIYEAVVKLAARVSHETFGTPAYDGMLNNKRVEALLETNP